MVDLHLRSSKLKLILNKMAEETETNNKPEEEETAPETPQN